MKATFDIFPKGKRRLKRETQTCNPELHRRTVAGFGNWSLVGACRVCRVPGRITRLHLETPLPPGRSPAGRRTDMGGGTHAYDSCAGLLGRFPAARQVHPEEARSICTSLCWHSLLVDVPWPLASTASHAVMYPVSLASGLVSFLPCGSRFSLTPLIPSFALPALCHYSVCFPYDVSGLPSPWVSLWATRGCATWTSLLSWPP